jgi:hypothetical protein
VWLSPHYLRLPAFGGQAIAAKTTAWFVHTLGVTPKKNGGKYETVHIALNIVNNNRM